MCLEVFQQSPEGFLSVQQPLRRLSPPADRAQRRRTTGPGALQRPEEGQLRQLSPERDPPSGFPNFTDFGFNAIGVPRNRQLPANDDPAFYDLGLCGPLRTDLASHKDYCGQFRVPPLRNVALRRAFFHNGGFHSLDQVLAFYAERDTNPGKWYAKNGGRVDAFDDLPAAYRKNVNRERPFGGKPGAAPALDDDEIRDIIAFLKTLTDADVAKR